MVDLFDTGCLQDIRPLRRSLRVCAACIGSSQFFFLPARGFRFSRIGAKIQHHSAGLVSRIRDPRHIFGIRIPDDQHAAAASDQLSCKTGDLFSRSALLRDPALSHSRCDKIFLDLIDKGRRIFLIRPGTCDPDSDLGRQRVCCGFFIGLFRIRIRSVLSTRSGRTSANQEDTDDTCKDPCENLPAHSPFLSVFSNVSHSNTLFRYKPYYTL